jgi:hypothetical protein
MMAGNREAEAEMRKILVALLAASLAAPIVAFAAEQVAEPASGVPFDSEIGGLSLLGTGLRTKTILKVKVYAVGLYAEPKALAEHKGKTDTPAFYKALVWGDFRREIRMKFIRESIPADKIREAFADSLGEAKASLRDKFLAFFGDVKAGDEYIIRWLPGGTLETVVAGQAREPIADKTFAAAVFAIWLGEKPIQADIKRGLVSRAGVALK